MREDNNKIIGIMIPDECGKADKYELTAIMYNEEGTDEPVKEYSVFITNEDYEENKVFTTIKSNMYPTLLLFPDDENEGIGSLEYDLVDAGLIHEKDDVSAIVVSEVVNATDTVWNNSEVNRETYLVVTPKVVSEVNNTISIGENE